MASTKIRHRLLTIAAVTASLMSLPGCAELGENVGQYAKNIGDYLNLRNSLMDPSQVGRFDKAQMWGRSKPVTWPILAHLDMIDEPNKRWVNATDPLPSDLVASTREYVVGEGDFLQVSVYELLTPNLDYQRQVQVNELGNITLVNLNQLHVAGLTPTEIERLIARVAVEKGFLLANPGPQVSVSLLQSEGRVFTILGAVGITGQLHIIGSDFRLLDALGQAHDITGGTQPGMDYLYVIRPMKGAGVIPAPPTTQESATPPAGPARNPLDTLDNLNGTPAAPRTPAAPTAPATPTRPGAAAPAGGSDLPQYLRPLPTAMVTSGGQPTLLAQADLDAAIGSGGTVAPGTPRAGGTPATGGTSPVAAPPATTRPEDLLNSAVGSTTQPGQFIYVDGKWVPVGSASGTQGMSPEEIIAAATGLGTPRVIRIPINDLREGDPRYNIVIRPGDTIVVPNIEPGEFYMLGHVTRTGVYSLTGRRVTLKQAVAAAGGLDAVAIPRRCDLIRRVGDTEVTVQVDLQRIFDGEQPDMFLKPNDLINVGTDMIAPFLAVTRNAYRASYGWGFVYDRNFFIQPTAVQSIAPSGK